MYSDRNLVYILTILEAIEKLYIYSEKFDNAYDFWINKNQLNYNASSNLLITIGEATKKIDDELKIKFSNIEWNAISDLRNRLAHDYRGSDPDLLWQIITEELTDLKNAINEMLQFVKYDKKMLEDALNSEYYKNIQYLKSLL
ncbi:MAG: DUF86 domain-containing protein [Bacteroidales bacterium]|nr:DUF86 domain-containing protein [Bacteroidales bacterium]MBN2757771.1 DUF86 domain-containing protein [Bacteroidales bacterium]